jgi:serine/threonine-protein kinase
MEAFQTATVTIRKVPDTHLSRRLAAFRAAMWRWRFGIAVAVVAVMASTGAYFWKAGKWSSGKAVAGASAVPSVFDKYLQGVELMKRWDKEGNLERAVALLTDATKSDPSFALGFARLAEAQRLRYALSRDKTFLDAATSSAEMAVKLNPELAPVQVSWGRVQAAKGNSDLAMASFEHALRIDSNDADAQLAIARQYERLGRISDAEGAYQKALSLDPDGIAVHDFYANFLFRQSRHSDAIREWQTVVRLAPDDAPAWVNLGASMSESGRIAEAITTYEQAVKLKPTAMAYSNLGTAYSRSSHYPEAADAYRKAVGLDPNDSMIWGNMAFVYSWMKDDQAKKTFEHAIELAEGRRKDNPRDPFVTADLAQYYAKSGNAALARQRIDTAFALSPKSPDIQARAAVVFELLGQRAKALEYAKKALSLGYSRQGLQREPELSKLMAELK